MKSIVKLGVTLFVVCALAAGSLAFFYSLTEKPIARQRELETQDALTKVAPEATEFRVVEKDAIWEALKDGSSVGRVLAIKAKGYGGPIGMVVGIGADGRLTGVRVVSQTETPGLGNKVSTEPFLRQFVGLGSQDLWLRKDSSQGKVDAISAATISSRAVTAALRAAAGGQ